MSRKKFMTYEFFKKIIIKYMGKCNHPMKGFLIINNSRLLL